MIFHIQNKEYFRKQALLWAQKFSHFAWLDNNQIHYLYNGFPNMLAVGEKSVISSDQNGFNSLQEWQDKNQGWLFGFFTYDLKNEIEKLQSKNPEYIEFPSICFFEPEHLLLFEENQVTIQSENPEAIFEEIHSFEIDAIANKHHIINSPAASVSKENYIKKVDLIKEHLRDGDIYELNYCIEFTAQGGISPVQTYLKLNEISPMPFSCLIKVDSLYLISASPERFLKKEGKKLISQPIKGTRKRGATLEEDIALIEDLKTSEKEIAENMMIVDLVRNDLSRSCKPGTVIAEEIFGVHTFQQVHQMISTITGEMYENTDAVDAIKNAFPMGSMTGAPKIRAMELIDEIEESKRGIFSGAAGFFTRDGDFDLNVIIRSIFYDEKNQKISFQVGSAITYEADAEKEYEECMLKAGAMLKVLE
ncbi:para-aminobenzoate synthase, aminase component [Sporocytophaga myxococcoides]|uniref:Para-aminobenzoate synthase, aminase component n=1 Tax=Sporocytophaga myxococcoides TaxID=153721 RepID=A0A098LJA0_9BACT|nr:anthranilate synthase component I family protein [Sporocytophaga myxococcoides]GAL86544.1 para-aminobenzoate synthase, aminase component [Sporocytophaga myxococcoides]